MGSLLIWLSGARPKILALSDVDRPKYSGMGSAVLITATVAGISMTFALHSALKAPLTAAIPLAVAWGLAIMSLDRWLVVSLVRQRNKLGYLMLALPRVALGVLFGLIISTPFTLQIFQSEISQQIVVIQHHLSDTFYARLATGSLAKHVEADKIRMGHDQTAIADSGSVNLAQDPAVAELMGRLAAARRDKANDYNQWHCEMYGTPDVCSSRAGNGPAAQADHKSYLHDVAKINSLEGQITTAEGTLAAKKLKQAQQDLPSAREVLKTDQAVQEQQRDSFNINNASNAGLLRRLQALDQYAAGDSTLQAARWLLFLFFTAIECLPVLIKVLLNLGPENTYEILLARAEQASLEFGESVMPELMQDIAKSRLPSIREKRTSGQQQRTFNGSPNGLRESGSMRYRNDRL